MLHCLLSLSEYWRLCSANKRAINSIVFSSLVLAGFSQCDVFRQLIVIEYKLIRYCWQEHTEYAILKNKNSISWCEFRILFEH